jgi:hypothetical protein
MAFSQLMGKARMSHQKLTAGFPTAKPRYVHAYEHIDRVITRWQRRYRRKGFGRARGERRSIVPSRKQRGLPT